MGRAFEDRKEKKFKRWGAMAKAFTRIGKEIAISVNSVVLNPRDQLHACVRLSQMPKVPICQRQM
jgi:hypothetical protein